MNTSKAEPRFCTYVHTENTDTFGYECTRAHAGETENRDQVGLLWSNMLPLSSSLLFHPPASLSKTPPPSGHTCGQHTRNIHKQSSISRCPLSGEAMRVCLVFLLVLSLSFFSLNVRRKALVVDRPTSFRVLCFKFWNLLSLSIDIFFSIYYPFDNVEIF